MIPNASPMLDFDLGETADAIRETTARFSQDVIAPLAAEIDVTNEFPRHLWPQMGELGLHGITVEEADGGLGLGYLEHVVAMEEVSSRLGLDRPELRRPLEPLREPGPPLGHAGAEAPLSAEADQSGEHVGALAMSEESAGSDVISMRLRAERQAATASC